MLNTCVNQGLLSPEASNSWLIYTYVTANMMNVTYYSNYKCEPPAYYGPISNVYLNQFQPAGTATCIYAEYSKSLPSFTLQAGIVQYVYYNFSSPTSNNCSHETVSTVQTYQCSHIVFITRPAYSIAATVIHLAPLLLA